MIPVTVQEFLVALTLGAGAIALWINFRFPKLAPQRVFWAIIHVGAAILFGQVVLPGLHALIPDTNPVARALVTTFLLGLPALIYALLSSIWVIRIAQGALLRR
jgi:hypothetical protein